MTLLVAAACTILLSRALAWLDSDAEPWPALGAVAFTAAGVAGLALLAMSTRGRWISWAVFGAVVLAALVRMRLRPPGARTPIDPASGATRLALLALAPQLALMAFAALAPPTSIDALEYHLETPRQMWRAGGLAGIPPTLEGLQPMNLQLLYGLALPISDRLPGLLHTGMAAALALVIARLARRSVGPGAAAAGAIAAVATPMVAWEGPGAFVDLGVALLAACALAAIDRWYREERSGWLALAAVFAGLAAGSKATGPAIILALAAAVLVRGRLRSALAFGVLAALVASPWYLRVGLITGNPLYPLFSSDGVRESLATYGHGRDLAHLLLAPIDLILRGAAFDGGHYLGVAVLALAPAALLHPRARDALPAVAMGAVLLGAWLWAGTLQARLLLPLCAPAGLLAALGFEALARRGRALAALALVPVALTALAGLGAAFASARQSAPVVLGRESRDAYLSRSTIGYDDYAFMNHTLRPSDRVLLSARGAYYLDVPYTRCVPPACALRELDPARTRSQGFTHVYWTGLQPPWLGSPSVRLLRRAPLRVPTRRALGTFSTTESFLVELAAP